MAAKTDLDHNHSLFLHPSDTTGAPIISIQLTGSESYSTWSRAMKIQLLGKNKLVLVVGTLKKGNFDTELVLKELIAGILYARNARKVWEDLRERFDKVNASRDEFHSMARTQIFMISPTPSINKAYAIFVEWKSQRSVDNASVVGEGIDLAALLAGKGGNYQNHQKPKRNWNKRRDSEAIREGKWQRAPQLTADQYDQIMKLLNKDPPKEAMANMAGTTYSFMANIAKENLIVDTEATNHMVADLGMLTNVKDIIATRDKRVHLPSGDFTLVSYVGNCKITETGKVQDVLYVPEFAYNLLSVSKITRYLHCFVSFYPDFCLFQDLSNRKERGIGRKKDGLYLLAPKASLKAGNNTPLTVKGLSVRTIKKDIFLWHKRVGNASGGSLKELLGYKWEDCKSAIDSDDVCPMARHVRQPFSLNILFDP
ncbi:uncharacterized protein LOC142164019 [Nicotiana tabacum]|uniref:Uncharacterized protein LOC142164019 n=1 Tax=Nicotiana tabacum TaxID=4097 RepID=A0AC58RX16_TOBAC